MSSSVEGSANNAQLQAIIGPTLVGGLLSAALFGCLACQSYLYFARFASDGFALKTTVSAIILMQLGQFVCIISTLWAMTVSTYGDPSQLDVFPLPTDIVFMLSGSTVFIVHSFYAFRLWKLTRSILFPVFCEMLSMVAQISMFILAAKSISMKNITTFIDSHIVLIAISWISRAFCDIITTAGITLGLKKGRASDFRDTVTTIDRLIYWTLETALVTSLMSAAITALFIFNRQNFVWFGVWLLWPNVVGNSLLASLNRRLLFRETRLASRGDVQDHGGLNTISLAARATQLHGDSLQKFKNRDVRVQVLKEMEGSKDEGQSLVSKPAVVHIRASVSTDGESIC